MIRRFEAKLNSPRPFSRFRKIPISVRPGLSFAEWVDCIKREVTNGPPQCVLQDTRQQQNTRTPNYSRCKQGIVGLLQKVSELRCRIISASGG